MNKAQFMAWCQTTMPLSYSRRPLIMGILNITPDSFSDAGRFLNPEHAFKQAQQMIAEGADILDIGGESTRPGATSVSETEELERVIPTIERIRSEHDILISIDTQKPNVMLKAVLAGAGFINDVNALQSSNALSTAACLDVPVCLMHMQGNPQTMQNNPHYTHSIIDVINDFFEQRIMACEKAGLKREHLILDPGIGFGKTVQHNLLILKKLSAFNYHQCPILLGVSRKSILGAVTNQPVSERLSAGLAAAVFAVLQGTAIIRTHDVAETKRALDMLDSIVKTQEWVKNDKT